VAWPKWSFDEQKKSNFFSSCPWMKALFICQLT
jgi:hypothetical protein